MGEYVVFAVRRVAVEIGPESSGVEINQIVQSLIRWYRIGTEGVCSCRTQHRERIWLPVSHYRRRRLIDGHGRFRGQRCRSTATFQDNWFYLLDS
jgi:hypothetical protein